LGSLLEICENNEKVRSNQERNVNKLTIAILTGAILSAPLIGFSQDRAESRFSMNRSGGVDATGGNTDGSLNGYSSRRFDELAALTAPTIDLSAIEDRITNVQNDFNSTINNLESSMNGQINTVQSQLSGDLSAAESNFNGQLSNVQGMVNTNTNTMSSMESNLQGQIDSGITTMDSLARRVGTNESGIRGNVNTLSSQSSRINSTITLANTAQTRADKAYSKATEALNDGGDGITPSTKTVTVVLQKGIRDCTVRPCDYIKNYKTFRCSKVSGVGRWAELRRGASDAFGNYFYTGRDTRYVNSNWWEGPAGETVTCTQKNVG
jgi:hypothetical protein